MAEPKRVHLFGEDLGHERFITALTERIAEEEGREVLLTMGNARGGHGRAITELKTHQRALARGASAPDLLVVAIDANCEGWTQARDSISQVVDTLTFPAHVLAIPDPHVERWYMADPVALNRVLEVNVTLERRKCGREVYKRLFVSALREAGHPVTLGGAEFAREIVAEMDLFRAGKNEPSLKHFVDDVRSVLKSWR